LAAQVGALRVAVGADITGLQTGMKRAERQVQKSAGVMQRAVTGINKSFTGLGAVAGVSLGAAGILGAGRAFLSVADAAKSMTAQLKLATAEYGSFAQANKDVRAIAEGSRASLTATAELYSAIQRNAGELGNTQAQTARITETVSKSFAVFGASAIEAENATRQLVQAFQSGRLQGDEFRSLMENAPRLVKLLADSLGVTTGALREMSKEGELTADKLVKAFSDLKLTAELDKEFAAMPVTFDQAMTQLYNSALITFSAFDQGGQFINSIANFVTQGTTGFKELEESAFAFGRGIADLFVALEELRMAVGSLHTSGISAFGGLTDAAFSWRDALAGTLGVLDGMVNAVANLANFPGNVIRSTTGLGGAPIVNPSNMRGGFLAKSNKTRTDATMRQIMGRSLQDVLGEFGLGRNPPPFRPPPGKATKAKRAKKPPRDRSDDVEFQFENEIRQAQMDILRAQQDLAGSFGERSELSLKMLDLEGQQFEAELNDRVRRAKRDFAEGKITEATLKEVEAHAVTLRAKNDEADILKRQMIAQEAILHRKEREAALVDRGYESQLDTLRFNDEMAETRAEHQRIQLDIVDTLYKQKEAHLRALKAQLEFAGKIEEAADVQAELDRLPTDRARDQQRALQSTRSPMESWRAEFGDITDELEDLKVRGIMGAVDALGALTGGFDDFADAAKNAIGQVLAELIRLQLMKLAVGLFGGAPAAAVPGTATPGFAGGGAFSILGRGGVDKNVLSLNGLPIARVSYGERVNIMNDNGQMAGGISVHAPITVLGNATRETPDQVASAIRRRVATATRKGY
jgi:tape measure domain-containing protein